MSSPSNRGASAPETSPAKIDPEATAHERRASAEALVSRTLRSTLADHDVSHRKFGLAIGRSRHIVDDCCDPDDETQLSVANVICAPTEIAVAIGRVAYGSHGYNLTKTHAHDTIADDIDHLAEMNVEDAGLTAEILRAFGDGAFTAAEATKVKTLLRESIERREALIARCDEAVASRVSPLRRAT
jgi:hypothetical protein